MKTDFDNHKIYSMPFATVYPHYITKVERKGRKREEVDQAITWLTGYTSEDIKKLIENQTTFKDLFENAPKINNNAVLIKGVICGVRIEEIEHPLMKNIRYMDKLVDEIAKGRPMEKILRK